MDEESKKYRNFVQGYIALCEENGLYFDLTNSNELGVFKLGLNVDDFEKQIMELKGGL